MVTGSTHRSHMIIHQAANMAFMIAASGHDNMSEACEAKYQHLYDDIVEHPGIWFDNIFASLENHTLLEKSCGIIGTLGSIQKKKGKFDKVQDIIEVYTKIMNAYRDMVTNFLSNIPHGNKFEASMDNLTYKYDLLVSNTYQHLEHKEKCLPSFRRGVEYELKRNFSMEQQSLAFIIPGALGMNDPKYEPLTLQKLQNVSNNKCWEALIIVNRFDPSS